MSPLLLLVIAALAAMVVLFNAVHRDSRVGAVLVLAVTVLQEVLDGRLGVDLGLFAVTLNDIVAVLLAGAAAARLLRMRSPAWSQLWIVGLGVLVVLLALRGAREFGLDAAVNEARKYVWLLSTALYFSTVAPRPALLERIGRTWLVAAGALLALAVVRWLAQAAGLSGGVWGVEDSLRVIPSAPTLMIAQGCLIATASWARSRGMGSRVAVAAFALAVVFLQHRTVWVALAVGATVLLTRGRGVRSGVMVLIVIVVGALSVAAFIIPQSSDGRVAADLEQSATNTQTFEWRYEGWRELIENSPSTLDEVVVGLPFGTGYGRVVDGIDVEVSPHNFYLQTYLRLGLVGLVGLVGLHVALALRLRRSRGGGGLMGDHVLFVLLISAALYDLTYAPSLVDGILLGLAASAAARAPVIAGTTGTTGTTERVLTHPSALARAGR